MLLSTVKSNFETKLSIAGGLNPPEPIALAQICHEAMSFVASKCTPRELLRDATIDTNEILFRSLPRGHFLVIPEYPNFDITDPNYNPVAHLQMDEDLNFAVISKMAALYSKDSDSINKFDNECERVINIFKANFNKIGE